MLERSQLQTVHLVPLTAFDRQGQLALEPMRRHVQRMAEAGISSMLPCAGSAEFDSLSPAEICSVIEMFCDELDSDIVVTCPIGGPIEGAIELCQSARSAGADAVMVMPLSFPYICNDGARDYYQRVLDESPLPVILYKKAPIPSNELLLELAEHDNLIAVKYAVNDLDAFRRVVLADGDRVEWICGSAERFAPFFALAGATGFTSGAANLCPRIALSLHDALVDKEWSRAMEIQNTIRPIEDFRARDESSYNIAMLKYAITHSGLDFGSPRPPQRRLSESEMREVDRLLSMIFTAEHALEAIA